MSEIVISNNFCMKLAEEQFVPLYKKEGVKRIEFFAASPYLAFDNLENITEFLKKTACWKKRLYEAEISVFSLMPEGGSYPVNLADIHQNVRQKSIDYYKAYIEAADKLGASLLCIEPGWHYVGVDKKRGRALAADSLRILRNEAGKQLCFGIGISKSEGTNVADSYEALVTLDKYICDKYTKIILKPEESIASGELLSWYIYSFKERIAAVKFDGRLKNLFMKKTVAETVKRTGCPLIIEEKDEKSLLNPTKVLRRLLEDWGK